MDITSFLFISVVAGVICLALIYKIYVDLIQKKNKVKEAFSSIDVQLKRRYDLIPNILSIASKFMEHERNLIEDVTKLRTEALKNSNMNNQIETNKKISDTMNKLFASFENYPQLKSDATMLSAMETYNDIEAHIAAARRFYNSAVLDLNNAVEIFPSSLFASIMAIKKLSFFETSEVERKPINANEYLK